MAACRASAAHVPSARCAPVREKPPFSARHLLERRAVNLHHPFFRSCRACRSTVLLLAAPEERTAPFDCLAGAQDRLRQAQSLPPRRRGANGSDLRHAALTPTAVAITTVAPAKAGAAIRLSPRRGDSPTATPAFAGATGTYTAPLDFVRRGRLRRARFKNQRILPPCAST